VNAEPAARQSWLQPVVLRSVDGLMIMNEIDAGLVMSIASVFIGRRVTGVSLSFANVMPTESRRVYYSPDLLWRIE
jgi:hypothetical protein